MESLFFGESANAFFSFNDLNTQRKILQPVYPKPYYKLLGDSKVKYTPKVNGEIRLITIDVATMGGAKNDASAISLLQIIPNPNGKSYSRNVPYMETLDGGHGQDQAIRIRQLYDDFDADYVIIDTNGVGITVYDQLTQEQFDGDRNIAYEPWSCINDDAMAARSRNPDAPKIIYSIKATAQFNSDAAVLLRDNMRRGKIKFLANEADGKEWLMKSRQYREMTPEEQVLFEAPFVQISAFVNEIVNLDYDVVNGRIRVKEKSNNRKDRYSSVSYANYIANEIERELKNREENIDAADMSACVSAIEF